MGGPPSPPRVKVGGGCTRGHQTSPWKAACRVLTRTFGSSASEVAFSPLGGRPREVRTVWSCPGMPLGSVLAGRLSPITRIGPIAQRPDQWPFRPCTALRACDPGLSPGTGHSFAHIWPKHSQDGVPRRGSRVAAGRQNHGLTFQRPPVPRGCRGGWARPRRDARQVRQRFRARLPASPSPAPACLSPSSP